MLASQRVSFRWNLLLVGLGCAPFDFGAISYLIEGHLASLESHIQLLGITSSGSADREGSER
ncbi:MAG: hypothetical protein JWM85_1477 [Acidimicrobiaceae bacterium]|nr:hypothetical protein [Acidimicrobiaceae bacterium]